MDNKCLLEKYESEVNNDSLKYFGMVAEELFSNSLGVTKVVFNKQETIKILHGSVGGNTEVTFNADEDVPISSKGTVVVDGGYDFATIIIPKYDITAINIFGTSLAVEPAKNPSVVLGEFKYSPITSLIVTNSVVTPDFDVMDKVPILAIYGNKTTITEECDISNLGANGIKTAISFAGVSNSNLKGSLDKCGCSPIIEFNLPNTKTVSLNIENFVAYNRGAGRTTGSLSLLWVGACNCTFNGAAVAKQENNSLSWTANTITFNGTEISNSDVLVP